jgi:hypothetical protein
MSAPQQPTRAMTSAPRCDQPVGGGGMMSYHCSLPQGHDVETLDLDDPQPCWAVESDPAARRWKAWSEREYARKQAAVQPRAAAVQTIPCPVCHEPAMKVRPEGGECENCGAKAEIQQSDDVVTEIGEQMLPGDGDVARREIVDPERDADIIAAAKAVAPEQHPDGCLGEYDPAINLACSMRPATPPGIALVDPGPQPLRPDQVPEWVVVAEGSAQPNAGQVQHMQELHTQIHNDFPGQTFRAYFENDEIGFRRIEDEILQPHGFIDLNEAEATEQMQTVLGVVGETEAEPHPGVQESPRQFPVVDLTEPVAPTKQREGDQTLPVAGVDCVQDIVIEAMEESKRVGVERYGQTLMTFNGRKGMQDIVDEARDFFVYGTMMLREAEATREVLVDAVAKRLAQIEKGLMESYAGEINISQITHEAIAEAVVDTIMGWVIGQRVDVHVSPSLTERLDMVEAVLKPLGIINRAVSMEIDTLYVDRDADPEEHPHFAALRAAQDEPLSIALTYGDWIRDDLSPLEKAKADELAAETMAAFKHAAKAAGYLKPGVDDHKTIDERTP